MCKNRINDLEQNCNLNLIINTDEVLSDKKKNGKEQPWRTHKINSLKLYALYQIAKEIDEMIISDNRLQNLYECASLLLFMIDAEQRKKLKSANFCRLRTCPTCNWRKSLKLFGQVSQVTNKILEQTPTTRFIFVTLTVKNCSADELENTINLLNKGFKKLTDKSKRMKSTTKFKSNLLGYMKAIEITYDSEIKITKAMYRDRKKYYDSRGLKVGSVNPNFDSYHPHIHCIFAIQAGYFDGDNYIKQSEWQEIWGECCGLDYEPLIHIRKIDNNQKAVAEMAKYPVKMDDLANFNNQEKAVEALIVFTKILHGRRLTTFGGIFNQVRKQLKLDDIDKGNLIQVGNEDVKNFNPIGQALYKFNTKLGCYIC